MSTKPSGTVSDTHDLPRPPTLRNHPPGKAEAMAEMRAKVMAMRVAGHTFRAIGAALGISDRHAKRHAARALKIVTREERQQAGQYRALLMQRLEAMNAAVWTAAAGGDLEAVDRVVRIVERVAKLQGLEAITPEATGGGGLRIYLSTTPPHPPIETTATTPATIAAKPTQTLPDASTPSKTASTSSKEHTHG